MLLQSLIFNAFAEAPVLNAAPKLEAASSKTLSIEQKLPLNNATTSNSNAATNNAATSVAVDADTPTEQVENQTITIVEPAVFVHKVKGKMNKIYKRLFTGLENNGYYVIFEPNIGRNLAHFAKRWGKDYNKNKLDSIRSMVFCNGWYANKISNEDPDMLALCPLHVTLVHKEGYTRVLFVKPGILSQGSAANSIALELEQDVIRIIKESAR